MSSKRGPTKKNSALKPRPKSVPGSRFSSFMCARSRLRTRSRIGTRLGFASLSFSWFRFRLGFGFASRMASSSRTASRFWTSSGSTFDFLFGFRASVILLTPQIVFALKIMNKPTRFQPSEGVIIECPLNELFHNVVIIILTSWMVVGQILITVAVNWNVGIFFH